MPTTKAASSPTVRLPTLAKVGGMLLAVLLAYRFFDQLAHVFLIAYGAAIFAVAINVIVRHLPLSRRWVVALIAILVVSLIIGGIWFGGPLLLRQLRNIAERAPDFERQLQSLSVRIKASTGLNIDLANGRLAGAIRSLFGGSSMIGQAKSAAGLLLLPVLVFVGGLFAVASPNDRLLVPMLRVVPREQRDKARRVLDLLGERLSSWIQGQLLAMAAVGALATAALLLIGVPNALLLGLLSGLTEFIPLAGPWMGGVTATAVAALDSPQKGLWTAMAMFAIQLIEMNLITPFAMSKVVHIHPFITLFALVVFGSLFGFLGMLLALPLVLLIWTVVQVFWVEGAIDTDTDRIADVVEE